MQDNESKIPQDDNLPANRLDAVVDALVVAAGGVPKAWRKLAESAVGKLVGAGLALAIAKLNAKKADIEQEQAEKSKFRKAITKQAIAALPENPALAHRAMNFHFDDIFEKQQRRENVALFALQELADAPPPPHGESEPPPAAETLDEDWLTGLQRHAENATSERLQQMFGRILAGEIRRPGSFSLFTLDLVSKLSPTDAANIVKIAPFVVGNILMRDPIVPLHINYGIPRIRENSGIGFTTVPDLDLIGL